MLAKSISGAAAAASPAYIEDVFSTYLYTGTSSAQTINNGIDLAGNGGLVWLKWRSNASGSLGYENNALYDSARGQGKHLISDGDFAEADYSAYGWVPTFLSNGFSFSSGGDYTPNDANALFASWTFRKKSKFFDVVTYTGNGSNRTISHNLGSVPGCIIIKRRDTTASWQVYHRSLANTEYMVLNSTAAKTTGTTRWNSTTPTSTEFSLGTDTTVNANGGTYVAYLFAHDAGGFGLTGTDNVISCGSYTGNGSATGPTVTLGWEPQFVIVKNASAVGPWNILDVMRGQSIGASGVQKRLGAQNANAEENVARYAAPNATGWQVLDTDAEINTSGQTYIYIAIRRGPMKVPTSGTSVFDAAARADGTGGADITASNTTSSIMFVDLALFANRAGNAKNFQFADKLRGFQSAASASADTSTTPTLVSSSTSAEATSGNALFQNSSTSRIRFSSNSVGAKISYAFKRAPGFFDVVAYTGNGANRTVTHNLGAAPELIIVKARGASGGWPVYSAETTNTRFLFLNTIDQAQTSSFFWNNTSPTSSVFTVGTHSTVNNSGITYVAYLFASITGVSKVGSYVGNGSSQTVNCGFTGGARFVLIKQALNGSSAVANWYVFDTARGIVSGNDPSINLNDTAAEATGQDAIDPNNSGFIVNQSAATDLNVNGATYIYLAIA